MGLNFKTEEKAFEWLRAANPGLAAKAEASLSKGATKEGSLLGKTIKGAGLIGAGGLAGLAAGSGKPTSSVVSSPSAGNDTLGSAARGGIKGSGSLPALKSASSPSVSDSMTTNKILVQAVKYLASIDASLKNQVAFQRFEYTDSQNSQREMQSESKPGLIGNIGNGVGNAIGDTMDGIFKTLAKTLMTFAGAMAALSAPGLIDKIIAALADPKFQKKAAGGAITALSIAEAGFRGNKIFKEIKAAQSIGKAISGIGGMVKPAEEVVDAAKAAKTFSRVKLPGAKHFTMVEKAAEDVGKIIKPAEKDIAKTLTKDAGKGVFKGLSKTAALTFLKKIPGISFLIGLGLGGLRLSQGDAVGAGMEVLSGFLGSFPGIGSVASLAVDTAIIGRDLYNGNKEFKETQQMNNPRPTNGPGSGSLGRTKGAKNYVPPKQIYDYIKSKGLTDNQAKGMMANIQAESSFDSANVNPNDRGAPAGGLFQHRADRFTQMKAYVGNDWQTNWKKQIDFALSEQAGRQYSRTNFDTAAEATATFTKIFEKPADLAATTQKRVNNLAGIDKAISAPVEKINNAAVGAPKKSVANNTGKGGNVIVNNNNNVNATKQHSSGGKVHNPAGPQSMFAYFNA